MRFQGDTVISNTVCMSLDWHNALESLNEYRCNSFDLPSDNSLISPIARVILQKRRLLKIQEIHNILLQVSSEPSESITQSNNEREFLTKFRPTFANIHWNELSVCEAQGLSSLIVDALYRCQADSQLVNLYIREAVAEIQGPDMKNRSVALRSCIILVRAIFKAFPKQAGTWANDLLKAILDLFKSSSKNSGCFDCTLEGIKCLQTILRLPSKFTDMKDREKVPSIILKYLKVNNSFIAIEATKALEVYYDTCSDISKSEIKDILDHLNGDLSLKLRKYKCSSRLLEFCFEFRPEKGSLDIVQLRKNIERVRKFTYIDSALFSDAFANVLIRWNTEKHGKIVSLLLPFKGSKSFVSAICFAKTIELAVERSLTYNESIKMMRFAFENVLGELLNNCTDEYSIELIDSLKRLYKKFPESFKESDFSSFAPLTKANDLVQLKSVELISKVFKDRPIVLTAQLTLIFAQLKGDFLRLKHKDASVLKDAVKGLMKLFTDVLKLSLSKYLNYCDHEMILKIKDWTLSQLTANEDTEWIKSENDIARGLFSIASVLSSSVHCSNDITTVIIEFCGNGNQIPNKLLGYFLNLLRHDPDQCKLFFGIIEKCLHELNSCDQSKWPEADKLVPLMRIIVEEKQRPEFNSVAGVCLIAKIIAFHECSNNSSKSEDFKFSHFAEYFAKMFWRSSEQTQDYCMVLWLSSLKGKKALVPVHILQTIRSILECSEIKVQGADHRDRLIHQIQDIIKEFLLDDDFAVRLQCGIVLGLIVRLFNDLQSINDLFEQSMKHAMAVTSKNRKSRVCYIMGIASLKANLENDRVIELSPNALIGLIASWGRENNVESRSSCREISAASIAALAYYIEKCGGTVNSEFYRDSCELLLEQIFIKDRCDLMVQAVKELAKSLSLYVNLLPCQSQFITKTVRVLLESSYLRYYGNDCIELSQAISEFNPQISAPSPIIFDQLKKSVVHCSRGSFGLICQYLSLQISFDNLIAFEVIDCGLLMVLLERANNPECFETSEYKLLAFLIEKILSITISDRFKFWMDQVFEPLNLNGGERRSQIASSPMQEVSNSGFSLADLKDSLKLPASLRPSSVHMILKPLAGNIEKLLALDPESMHKFLGFIIRICFNISAEKTNERKFYLTGMILFRGVVRAYSKVTDDKGISVLEPFDSQIVSIISSALRCSEEGDPLYAACAFGSFFNFICSRRDLQQQLQEGSGRISSLLSKSRGVLKEQEIFWSLEVVENLTVLSVIVGLCSLYASGYDASNDGAVTETLVRNIGEFFLAYKSGKLDKNIRLSLSGSDRLLLIETWLKLSSNNSECNPAIIEGIISVLAGMNSECMDQVCILAISLFGSKFFAVVPNDFIQPLLQQIYSYGLEKRDSMTVTCLISLLETGSYESLVIEVLNKFCGEFLSTRFSDFDAQFGLQLLKAQLLCLSQDQETFFGILKKLVGNCLNDIEVNNSKDMLKTLKTAFSHPEISKKISNDLIIDWIERLEDVDSIFLNQLVFFSVSSQPQIWNENTFKALREHFEKMLKSVNTLEIALDSWILLLKAQTKNSGINDFDGFVNNLSEQVGSSFAKYRGEEVDQVWERIFGLVQSICNACSEKDMSIASELASKALEELNDFK